MNSASANQQGVGLQVRGLRKSFNGQEVLKGLDFEVNPGEIFVIMGPSGSGKSVLLRHLIGLEEPDTGEILIEGKPIQSPEVMNQYRMAMVFQSGALLNSLAVGENVGLYLAEHRLKQRIQVTSLVVSHDRDLAFGVADRIAVISEGQIRTIGTPEEVKHKPDPVIQKFLQADFKRL